MAKRSTKKAGRKAAPKSTAAKRKAAPAPGRAGGRPAQARGTAAKKTERKAVKKPARKAVKRPQASSNRQSDKTLEDLFHETLKDIYHAEKQILRALPKMARGATSAELRDAFLTHRDETQGQVERLEQVFGLIGKRPQAKPCHAIMGLVEEGQEVLEEFKGSPAIDAGLLAGAQAVEHYEMSRYGTLRAWAEALGMDEAAELLAATLAEEKHADELLTQIADSSVNDHAKSADDEEGGDDDDASSGEEKTDDEETGDEDDTDDDEKD